MCSTPREKKKEGKTPSSTDSIPLHPRPRYLYRDFPLLRLYRRRLSHVFKKDLYIVIRVCTAHAEHII
jgi:hypothetical protein